MPFWSKEKSDESQSAEKNFSDGSAAFAQDSVPISAPSSSPSAGGGLQEMQQFAMAMQQRVILEATITTLAEKAFVACITKPSDSLSGSEVSCIHAVTNKWLDTNQFLVKRMEKKAAAGNREPTY